MKLKYSKVFKVENLKRLVNFIIEKSIYLLKNNDNIFNKKDLTISEIGSILKNYREKNNLSIGEVAKKISVKISYVYHLENNNYQILITKLYLSSFIKSYAKLFKLDENFVKNEIDRIYKEFYCDSYYLNKNNRYVNILNRRIFFAASIFVFTILSLVNFLYYDFEDFVRKNTSTSRVIKEFNEINLNKNKNG